MNSIDYLSKKEKYFFFRFIGLFIYMKCTCERDLKLLKIDRCSEIIREPNK